MNKCNMIIMIFKGLFFPCYFGSVEVYIRTCFPCCFSFILPVVSCGMFGLLSQSTAFQF